MKENHIVALDIGNGGIKAATFYCNEYLTSLFFPKYATGKRNLSALDRDSVAKYGINPEVNGNTEDLYITRNGSTYFLGLSAHTVDGTVIRETGFSRYSQVDHMQNMFLGSLKGLFNGGWRPSMNSEISLGLGMPPKWYYDDQKYNEAYNTIEEAFDDTTFKLYFTDNDLYQFKVVDLAVMSEAIGGYYDHMFDEGIADNFTELGDPTEGTLIVDVGFGTLDCAIIKDYKLGSINELMTDPKLGCHQLFADAVNRLGPRYDDFDELELLFHTGQSRLDLSQDELRSRLNKVTRNYLSTIRSAITRKYIHSRSGFFSKIILMGGITKIISHEELERAFNFSGVSLFIGDEFANVRGYDKLLRDEAAS